jgi:hypothetical protein
MLRPKVERAGYLPLAHPPRLFGDKPADSFPRGQGGRGFWTSHPHKVARAGKARKVFFFEKKKQKTFALAIP